MVAIGRKRTEHGASATPTLWWINQEFCTDVMALPTTRWRELRRRILHVVPPMLPDVPSPGALDRTQSLAGAQPRWRAFLGP